MKDVTDVIFVNEDGSKSEFAHGFSWGCAFTAGLCLVIVALAAAFGG